MMTAEVTRVLFKGLVVCPQGRILCRRECEKVSDNSHLKCLHALHKIKMHTLWTQTAHAHEQRHAQRCDYEDCFSLSYSSMSSMRAGNRLVSRTSGQTSRRQWLALLSRSKQDKLQTNTTEVPSMQDCVYIVFNTPDETDAHTKPLSPTHMRNFCIGGWWSMPTDYFIPPPPPFELVSWWLWLSWCPGAVSCAGLEFLAILLLQPYKG